MEQKLHNVAFLHSLLIYTISNMTVKNAPNRACSFGTRVCWVQEISFFGHKINLLFTIKNNIKLITIRLSNDSICTPLLMRFFGPGKIRVKGKPRYRRSIFVLKPKNGEYESSKTTFFVDLYYWIVAITAITFVFLHNIKHEFKVNFQCQTLSEFFSFWFHWRISI